MSHVAAGGTSYGTQQEHSTTAEVQLRTTRNGALHRRADGRAGDGGRRRAGRRASHLGRTPGAGHAGRGGDGDDSRAARTTLRATRQQRRRRTGVQWRPPRRRHRVLGRGVGRARRQRPGGGHGHAAVRLHDPRLLLPAGRGVGVADFAPLQASAGGIVRNADVLGPPSALQGPPGSVGPAGSRRTRRRGWGTRTGRSARSAGTRRSCRSGGTGWAGRARRERWGRLEQGAARAPGVPGPGGNAGAPRHAGTSGAARAVGHPGNLRRSLRTSRSPAVAATA